MRIKIKKGAKVQREKDGKWLTTKREITVEAVASRFAIYHFQMGGIKYSTDFPNVRAI